MISPETSLPPDGILTQTGKKLSDITLEAVENGHITHEDIKISKQTLQRQRDIAKAHHRPQLAANFDRAGELVSVPDTVMLDIYNKLRPYRATKEELVQIAGQLLEDYHAPQCAQLVLDAADTYEERGLLR